MSFNRRKFFWFNKNMTCLNVHLLIKDAQSGETDTS